MTALRKVPSETASYLDYIQDKGLDFPQACTYIRERALLKSTFAESDNKRFHRAASGADTHTSKANMGYSEVYTIMKNWASETDTDMYHVYTTMNASAPLRESLMIVTKLWVKLAPAIK